MSCIIEQPYYSIYTYFIIPLTCRKQKYISNTESNYVLVPFNKLVIQRPHTQVRYRASVVGLKHQPKVFTQGLEFGTYLVAAKYDLILKSAYPVEVQF